jgi:hypothetical protein
VASLRELQRSFMEGVLRENSAAITRMTRGNGLAPARRIGIYRNNAREGFLKAMQATFPVLLRLSGEDWFRQTAGSYMQQHPSQSGNLHYIGEPFASFLEVQLVDSPYLYFADVARLEWAYQEVLVAADHPELDVGALAGISPDDYEALKFTTHPALRLFASRFPVFAIWQANQPGSEATMIDLARGACHVLIIRREDHVELRELPPDQFALLRAFVERKTFRDSAAEALAVDPDLDLAAALAGIVQLRTLVDFAIDRH